MSDYYTHPAFAEEDLEREFNAIHNCVRVALHKADELKLDRKQTVNLVVNHWRNNRERFLNCGQFAIDLGRGYSPRWEVNQDGKDPWAWKSLATKAEPPFDESCCSPFFPFYEP